MTNYTKVQLSQMPLSEITSTYNELAAAVGAKPVKRFSTKPAAIERFLKLRLECGESLALAPAPEPAAKPVLECLSTQSDWAQVLEQVLDPAPAVEPVTEPEAAVEPVTEPEAKTTNTGDSKPSDIAQSAIEVIREAKEGTLAAHIIQAVKNTVDGNFTEVAEELISVYTRPKSEKKVDMVFATRKIKMVAKKGFIKLHNISN